ncbi:hypothetical protein [Candidatus Poriferisocius sp.]|uniref:hypothetical protein n=1 Tax=Candidatus Poriferisocius sp. TaxID=3101276 RepID=UPI003B029287
MVYIVANSHVMGSCSCHYYGIPVIGMGKKLKAKDVHGGGLAMAKARHRTSAAMRMHRLRRQSLMAIVTAVALTATPLAITTASGAEAPGIDSSKIDDNGVGGGGGG